MKTFVCAFLIFTAFTQESNNEIKLNPIYLFSPNKIFPVVSYERSIGNKSAFGIATGILIGSMDAINYVDDLIRYDFSALPYYRYYFGKKHTSGFFLEQNAILLSKESFEKNGNKWRFGLGMGVGVKLALKNSWSIDFLLGGGFITDKNRDQNSNEGFGGIGIDFPELYPRLGVTIGKRF